MEDVNRVVVRVLTNSLTAPSGWTLTARDLRWAKVLLGQYRKADIDEPEIFIQGWARIFSGHSDEVVRTVVDPRGGIATTINWVATAKELYQACNAEAARIAEKARREDDIRKQIEEREQLECERASRPQSYQEIAAGLQVRGLNVDAEAKGRLIGPEEVNWGVARAVRENAEGVRVRRDRNYMQRIADDLAARRERNALRAEGSQPAADEGAAPSE